MNLCRTRRKLLLLALAAAGPLRAAAPRVVELSVVRRKPEGGVRTLRVARGEALALRVRADEAMTIHIHGYEVELRVDAGATATVELNARLVGRFPVTAHLPDSHGDGKVREPTLLYLEVHPE